MTEETLGRIKQYPMRAAPVCTPRRCLVLWASIFEEPAQKKADGRIAAYSDREGVAPTAHGSASADHHICQRVRFPQPHPVYPPLLYSYSQMFRAVRFNTIRRTLHTQARSAPRSLQANRLAFAGAVSAVTLTYFTWRTSSPSKQLAMDTNRPIRKHL